MVDQVATAPCTDPAQEKSNEDLTVSDGAGGRRRIAYFRFPGVLCGCRHSSTEGTLGTL